MVGSLCPEDKLLTIKSLKQKDNVVRFIGGWTTRDTPVLQEADHLNTILESGGQEYKKIQKFIQIQIISNISALLITTIETICLGESSTTILQVLYLNLVLAVLGGLMLVMKLRHKELSNNQVGKRNKSIITKLMRINILVQVSYQVFIFLMFHFKGEALHIPSMNPMNPWFKVAISVTDSEGPKAYWSQCIGLVSGDT
ncbi:Calcium-transporting ATPase 12, plasma membrane-type [Vitis vinifera]|nr:Calcium-transporting ATPase 12, plasma membrane-type [Vitis vinifera]